MKFEYWKAKDKKWYWHLRAKNGKIIAQGEGYRRKADCWKVIDLICESAADAYVNVIVT
jgi:uncharacterized protein YegP (UPF0339 family)